MPNLRGCMENVCISAGLSIRVLYVKSYEGWLLHSFFRVMCVSYAQEAMTKP